MQIIIGLLAILALIAAIVWGVSAFEGHHAQALQAQAAREIAQAAQISSIGQTVATTGLSVIAVLVLLLVVLAVVAYIFFRVRAAQTRKWASGPNARWQQVAGSSPAISGLGADPQMFQVLLQMQIMQIMQRMLGQQNTTTLNPYEEFDIDVEGEDWGEW